MSPTEGRSQNLSFQEGVADPELHIHKYVEIKRQLDAKDDFYYRSYCLLNMFRAPLCPSSGAREYYTSGCCLPYLVLWFSSCRYGVELRVVCLVCIILSSS